MGYFRKALQNFIFKKYDQFAEELGYASLAVALENTFGIYQMEGDTWYSATQLPDGQWTIWNDNQPEPPYPFEVFTSWQEAISCLRTLFEQRGLPEDHWMPEGFDESENLFLKEPDKEKML